MIHDVVEVAIDMTDFEKKVCNEEKCFQHFGEALAIYITCTLSQVTRRISNQFGFNVLQFNKESLKKPAETVQSVFLLVI